MLSVGFVNVLGALSYIFRNQNSHVLRYTESKHFTCLSRRVVVAMETPLRVLTRFRLVANQISLHVEGRVSKGRRGEVPWFREIDLLQRNSDITNG